MWDKVASDNKEHLHHYPSPEETPTQMPRKPMKGNMFFKSQKHKDYIARMSRLQFGVLSMKHICLILQVLMGIERESLLSGLIQTSLVNI